MNIDVQQIHENSAMDSVLNNIIYCLIKATDGDLQTKPRLSPC